MIAVPKKPWFVFAVIIGLFSGPLRSLPQGDAQPGSMEKGQKLLEDPEVGLREAVRAKNRFAFRFYAALPNSKKSPNKFISPFGVNMVLSLLLHGAGGKTRESLRSGLGVPEGLPEPKLASLDGAALRGLMENEEPAFVSLGLFTGLFSDKRLSLAFPYVELARTEYRSIIESLDFQDPVAAAGRIDRFVSEATGGMIPRLLAPADLLDDTLLVAVNAIHFKAAWTKAFDPRNTLQDGVFMVDAEKRVQVPMMGMMKDLDYSATSRAKLLSLRYGNRDRFRMDLVLPVEGSLVDFQRGFNLSSYEELIRGLFEFGVIVRVPRFSLEYEVDLQKPLVDLGFGNIFSELADFSRVTTSAVPLQVNKAVHRAQIVVDEEGTQAAAATGLAKRYMGPGPVRYPEFIADRPFMLLVRDGKTGLILFMGEVNDPSTRPAR